MEESDDPVPDILATSPIPSPKGNRRAVSMVPPLPPLALQQHISSTFTASSNTLATIHTSTSTVSSTTTSPINSNIVKSGSNKRDSFDSKEMKPLTSALEEMLLQQSTQIFQQQPYRK
ncbi:hypothetical protein DICPUDRAFT_158400 [Dictyostelium purpureum]|uniref:Uncharacterized protein n=1 Tax=Dictyostelium purpureum TaxID=5786 RepID=F1A1J1_DICPU|nr:uncharacterized protein DICPUDRAFT_158400 [Dictyostelium purpureum]EGC29932.1 hypothetical protein DICPUDRAFT_158400 [Dictyostelium purpureum]|eukprot:XP_003293535.1 hypothetical protein DICPUDRAFT_158400 [Dictyostelium purpureum]